MGALNENKESVLDTLSIFYPVSINPADRLPKTIIYASLEENFQPVFDPKNSIVQAPWIQDGGEKFELEAPSDSDSFFAQLEINKTIIKIFK